MIKPSSAITNILRESIAAYLGQGGQAIGRAGGIGDDVVLLGIVLLLVHAHHKHLSIGRWGRYDDLKMIPDSWPPIIVLIDTDMRSTCGN